MMSAVVRTQEVAPIELSKCPSHLAEIELDLNRVSSKIVTTRDRVIPRRAQANHPLRVEQY